MRARLLALHSHHRRHRQPRRVSPSAKTSLLQSFAQLIFARPSVFFPAAHARSTYFPDDFLYYSYTTCGNTNTFDSWFDAEAASGETSEFGQHDLVELATVIKDYLQSTSLVLESNEIELRDLDPNCATPSSCDCAACSRNSDASQVFGNLSISIGTATFTGVARSRFIPHLPWRTVFVTPEKFACSLAHTHSAYYAASPTRTALITLALRPLQARLTDHPRRPIRRD